MAGSSRLPGSPDHLPSGPFEWTIEEWVDAKKEVCRILIECAKLRDLIAYSDLASQIKSIEIEPHDVRFFSLLGEVSTDEHDAGRPLLTALVVHKGGNEQPGQGFFELARNLGQDTRDPVVYWSTELRTVYDHWAD